MAEPRIPRPRSNIARIAARAVEACVLGSRPLGPEEVSDLPPEVAGTAGAFVCLKIGGELRGCIGTMQPTRPTVVEEVVANAAGSCTRDPRFMPVKPEELPSLEVSVDVLSEPEPVDTEDELDPRVYGVIVRSGSRVGLLLPDLEGVDDVADQVSIARRKAGIKRGEPVDLFRFTVRRFD
ncbi:MAG: AmmeMemoRadiSam system protein A [Candidatus Geothermincolia bacterium]